MTGADCNPKMTPASCGDCWRVQDHHHSPADKRILLKMRYKDGHEQGTFLPTKQQLRKGRWSAEEDEKLINYITNSGLRGGSWRFLAKQADLQRCGKSCRLRWMNHLRPGLKRGAISPQEEQLIIHFQSILGNRWCQIAPNLLGRTDNEIKNYWNCCIKKKLLKHSLSSSSIDANGNADTKTNTKSVCVRPHPPFRNTYQSSHTTQPLHAMPEGYPPLLGNSFNKVTSAENRHACVPNLLELKQEQVLEDENRVFSCSQVWIDSCFHTNHHTLTSPSLQSKGTFCKASTSAKCDQLVDWERTLAPYETLELANNSVGCAITMPALVEISDSAKIENDGDIINENEMMMDHLSLTAYSSGITTWSANGHSNTTVFADVYHDAFNAHKGAFSILERCTSQQDEKIALRSCPPVNSPSQFSAAAITCANVYQYSNVQGPGDCQDHLILKNSEVNLDRRVQDGDQWDCSSIPNKEEKATPPPTMLGGTGSATFYFECGGEAFGQINTSAEEDHLYSISTDTDVSSEIDTVLSNWMGMY